LTSVRVAAIGKAATLISRVLAFIEVLGRLGARVNLIVVAAENHYETFCTKMMFIAAAYVPAFRGTNFRSADRKTLAYVDDGYTRHEKLALDYLRDHAGFNIVKLA
jgi:hypothetical protein